MHILTCNPARVLIALCSRENASCSPIKSYMFCNTQVSWNVYIQPSASEYNFRLTSFRSPFRFRFVYLFTFSLVRSRSGVSHVIQELTLFHY